MKSRDTRSIDRQQCVCKSKKEDPGLGSFHLTMLSFGLTAIQQSPVVSENLMRDDGEVGRGGGGGGGPETDPNTDHTLLLLIHMAMSGTTEALSLGSEGVFSFLLPGEA